MAKKDYYTTLGVPKSASDAELKSAYRKLARKHHPEESLTKLRANLKREPYQPLGRILRRTRRTPGLHPQRMTQIEAVDQLVDARGQFTKIYGRFTQPGTKTRRIR